MKEEMKKVLMLFSLILLMTSFASATICNMQTIVTYGKVYETGTTIPVSDATVIATCTHRGVNTTHNGISSSDGRYTIYFDKRECDYGDKVMVHSLKFGTSGQETMGSIEYIYPYGCSTKINSDNPNIQIPIIPEFGAGIALITICGAVAVFFVIRRR